MTMPAEGSGVAEAPAVEAPAAPATEAPAAPAESDYEHRSDFDSWSREDLTRELKKSRDEVVKSRQKYKPIAEAFDGLSPHNSREILDFVGAVKGWSGAPDDEAASAAVQAKVAAWAEGMGLSVSAAKAAAAEMMADATDDGDTPLTRKSLTDALAKWQADQAAEQQRAAQERARHEQGLEMQRRVNQRATELGYDVAQQNPAADFVFGTMRMLQERAQYRMDSVAALEQAHEALDGYVAQKIQEYVSGKRLDAARTVTPAGAASTAVEDTTPSTLDEASARARARIAAGQS